MSPLGNEDARAQVGTAGLSQRWRDAEYERRAKAKFYKGSDVPVRMLTEQEITIRACADELDAAKLRIEDGGLRYSVGPCSCCQGQSEIYLGARPLRWSSSDKELVESVCELLNSEREAVLKIIREIL